MTTSVTIAPFGEIDAASAPSFLALLDASSVPCGTDLDLDLARVTFMDTAGVEVLREVDRRLAVGHAHLRLRNAVPAVRRLLEVTGFAAT